MIVISAYRDMTIQQSEYEETSLLHLGSGRIGMFPAWRAKANRPMPISPTVFGYMRTFASNI